MSLSRNQATVLDALAEIGTELSGVDLREVVGDIRSSSIYAALTALQRDGFVDARWDTERSHPRHMFRINERGSAVLAEARTADRARRTALKAVQRKALKLGDQ